MKKVISTLLLLIPVVLSAQDYNPFVANSSIAPAPVVEVQSNGSALFNFTIGNRGTSAMPVTASQALKVSISLLRGVPNTVGSPPDGVRGPWAQYFSWTWNSFVKTLVGTQILPIPASDSGTISIDYLVTSNSGSASPQNGFNLNLVPPPYAVGSNLQADDNVNAFTYTTAIGLPVQVIDFGGKQIPAGNLLSWSTASELNSSYFDLYYGESSTSLKKLAKVSTKALNGQSEKQIDYQYLHNAPQDGANYYRLHSIDNDGREEVHNTINLYLKDQSTLTIYPNPASDNVYINYRNGELDVVNITLSDLQGRTVYKKKVVIYDNAFNEVVPIKNLAKGTYLLNIKDYEGYEYSQKITKK